MKRRLITLASLAVLVGLIIVQQQNPVNQPKADSSPTNIYDKLTPRGLGASSCNPDNKNCPSLIDNIQGTAIKPNLVGAIVAELKTLSAKAFHSCIFDNRTTNWISSQLGGSYSITVGLAQCNFTETLPASGSSLAQFNYTVTLGIPVAAFAITLHNDHTSTDGTDTIDMAGSIVSTGTVKGVYNLRNNKWTIQFQQPKETIKGSLNAPFRFSLNSDNDLTDNLAASAGKDLTIDEKNSTWTLHTSGTVSGRIDLAVDEGKGSPPTLRNGGITLSALEFCPTACTISDTETLHAIATKTGRSDTVTGKITVDTVHTENYTGTGSADLSTGSVHWNTDLHVTKDDVRKWTHKLADSSSNWTYIGDIHSTADLKPFLKYSKLVSDIKKDLDYQATRSMRGVEKGGAHINRHEENSTDNGVTTTIRTGTGSLGSTDNPVWSGVYDNQKEPYKTCDPSLYITSPASLAGQCNDPFSSIASKYTNTYLLNTIVPGFFTAGYRSEEGKSTTIQSRKTKALPQTITVFTSYLPGDPAYTPELKQTISRFKAQVQAMGVIVKEFSTDSPDKMKAALSDIASGAWVVNLGHGTPAGIYAGEDLVPWYSIDMILHAKQIKLDVFAADSCFAGHAPLSATIVGSISYGLGGSDATQGGIGSVFGIGSNFFHYTANDLTQTLSQMLGCRQN